MTGGGIVAAAAEAVTVGILATFLVFFFLRDGDKAWVWMFQAIDDQKRDIVSAAGDDALARVGGYLRGTTVLAGLIAITDYVFMLLLGVPLALPLAVLAFLSGYIPYFGGIVSTAIILLVTLSALGPGPAIAMLLLMGIRTAILGSFVRPLVYGRTVSIHPALVLAGAAGRLRAGGHHRPVRGRPGDGRGHRGRRCGDRPSSNRSPPRRCPRSSRPGSTGWRSSAGASSWSSRSSRSWSAILVTVPLVVIPVILAIILAATLEPLGRLAHRPGPLAWPGCRHRRRGRVPAHRRGAGAGVRLAGRSRPTRSRTGCCPGPGRPSDALGGQLGLASDAVASGALAAVQTIASLVDVGGRRW